MPKCPHGLEIGVYRGYKGAMAAPFSFCECCKTNFYYIDSGSFTLDRCETTTHDKHRCPDCGGQVTHSIIENGRTILHEVYPSALPGEEG